jgi:hypothetical protein
MRRNFVRLGVLVLLGAMFGGEIQASSRPGGARLIIQRAPNFGTNLFVRLSIDGKKVADIPWNQHYGGTIPAGRHVLSVLALPNTQSRRPTSMRVTVQSGRAYVFTATWQQDRLVLKPSSSYSPTTAVPAAR